jgi:hypothetical protein
MNPPTESMIDTSMHDDISKPNVKKPHEVINTENSGNNSCHPGAVRTPIVSYA